MRDCTNCVHARPYGGENDNRCSAWSCEYIDRNEAIKAWKELYGKTEQTEMPQYAEWKTAFNAMTDCAWKGEQK